MTTGDVVAAVARYGLAGSRLSLPAQPLPSAAWAATLERVEEQRVSGFLVEAIEDGAFPVTDDQAQQAADVHIRSMHVALALERFLVDVVRALEFRGIDYRVLKGSAYAHLVYDDPAFRSFGDIDILVPSGQYDKAVAVLRDQGAHRRVPELHRGFDRRFGKGGTFVVPSGHEIDLHRTFVFGPFGLNVRLADLFATSATFVVGEHELLALGAEERLMHACFDAALGARRPRLVPLRDVAQMVLHTALDREKVERLCVDWQAEAVVATAIRLAWETFALADVVPLSVWARQYELDHREEAALSLYTSRLSYSAQAAAALPSIPGLRAKAAYLRALTFPAGAPKRRLGDRLRRISHGARVYLPRVGRA